MACVTATATETTAERCSALAAPSDLWKVLWNLSG